MKDSLNIAIAGATGYVGVELVKILSKHPKVKILYFTGWFLVLTKNMKINKVNTSNHNNKLPSWFPHVPEILYNIGFNEWEFS